MSWDCCECSVLSSIASTPAVRSISLDPTSRLVDVDTANLNDGTLVTVLSVFEVFKLTKSPGLSVLARADGLTIVQSAKNASHIWERLAVGSARWRAQSEWSIDSVNGHDENPLVLKTYRELSRRWGSGGEFPGAVDVTQSANDSVSGDKLEVFPSSILPDAVLRFHGTATTVASGTITAKTDFVAGTAFGTITDGGQNFVPHLGQLLRIVGGPRDGAVATVVKIVTPNTEVRISRCGIVNALATPFSVQPTFVNPQVGDAYVIETQPLLPSFELAVSKTNQGVHGDGVVFNNLKIGGSSNDRLHAGPSNTNFTKCVFGAANFTGHYHMSLTHFASSVTFHLSNCTLWAGSKRGGTSFNTHHGASLFLREHFLAQGGPLPNPANGGFMEIFAAAAFDSGSDGIAVDTEGQLRISGPLWGSGNTGYGIRCDGRASYTAGNKPTITGGAGAGDTRIGGTVKAYADIPYPEPTNLAMLVQRAT